MTGFPCTPVTRTACPKHARYSVDPPSILCSPDRNRFVLVFLCEELTCLDLLLRI
jgi:hypothetical protein